MSGLNKLIMSRGIIPPVAHGVPAYPLAPVHIAGPLAEYVGASSVADALARIGIGSGSAEDDGVAYPDYG